LTPALHAHPQLCGTEIASKKNGTSGAQAYKFKREFGYHEREQRKQLKEEARMLKSMQTCWSFISSTTCCRKQKSSAARWLGLLTRVAGKKIQSVFIDDGSQSLEAACWIPILKSHRVILAGDHCQLPPTIKSNEAAKQGLAITLFEKGIANHPEMANDVNGAIPHARGHS